MVEGRGAPSLALCCGRELLLVVWEAPSVCAGCRTRLWVGSVVARHCLRCRSLWVVWVEVDRVIDLVLKSEIAIVLSEVEDRDVILSVVAVVESLMVRRHRLQIHFDYYVRLHLKTLQLPQRQARWSRFLHAQQTDYARLLVHAMVHFLQSGLVVLTDLLDVLLSPSRVPSTSAGQH